MGSALAALGIEAKSPERALGVRTGKARTCSVKPGPQATPILLSEPEFIELKNLPEMICKFTCFQSILKFV
jgi:hypothetical protein